MIWTRLGGESWYQRNLSTSWIIWRINIFFCLITLNLGFQIIFLILHASPCLCSDFPCVSNFYRWLAHNNCFSPSIPPERISGKCSNHPQNRKPRIYMWVGCFVSCPFSPEYLLTCNEWWGSSNAMVFKHGVTNPQYSSLTGSLGWLQQGLGSFQRLARQKVEWFISYNAENISAESPSSSSKGLRVLPHPLFHVGPWGSLTAAQRCCCSCGHGQLKVDLSSSNAFSWLSFIPQGCRLRRSRVLLQIQWLFPLRRGCLEGKHCSTWGALQPHLPAVLCVGASPGDLTEIRCLRCLCLSALVFLFRNRRCVILSSCALYALPSADKCTVWFCSLCWTPELCVAVLRGREHREPLEPGFSNYQRMF